MKPHVVNLEKFFESDVRQQLTISRHVDKVLSHSGLFAVNDTGVSRSVLQAAWDNAEAFFNLPLEAKRATRSGRRNDPYGYFESGVEALRNTPGAAVSADLKECYTCGPQRRPPNLVDIEAEEFCYQPTSWPSEPAGFRVAFKDYYREMDALARRLMRLFAISLSLEKTYFDRMISHSVSALRANNYPPVVGTRASQQLSAGAHTDYGSLTILRAPATSRGLQIFREGEWRDVKVPTDTFIVNIGDLMARWTNDRWKATLHRVVPTAKRRQSLVFFHQPNWAQLIECLPTCLPIDANPKYPPVLSGPYLRKRFLDGLV